MKKNILKYFRVQISAFRICFPGLILPTKFLTIIVWNIKSELNSVTLSIKILQPIFLGITKPHASKIQLE